MLPLPRILALKNPLKWSFLQGREPRVSCWLPTLDAFRTFATLCPPAFSPQVPVTPYSVVGQFVKLTHYPAIRSVGQE
jgi:hypothetical protein